MFGEAWLTGTFFGKHNLCFVPTFSKIAAPKLTIRASFLAMADISSFFIEEGTLSWKYFFTFLVDNTVVGNRSLASCCTLDHFGGVSWDRWGQFCRYLQSSDAMKKPIQLGQGKKLVAIPSSTSFGICTMINSPSPRSHTSQLCW